MWIEVKTSSATMRSESRIEVLVVVAVPRHERDEHVAAESQIAEVGRGTVRDDVALVDLVAHAHQRTLVDAGVLVRTLELHQPVDVDAGLARIEIFRRADDDTRRVHLVDHAAAAGADGGAGVTGDDRLHAGADERSLGAHQRHGLTLHVRAHQRAVGVVVLEERNERRGNRNQLLRRHVHQVDVLARSHHHLAGVAADDELVDELALLVELGVGLRDVVLGLFHRRQIGHVHRHLAVHDLAVRRLDEAVLVDAGEGRERVDQADVRAFRRLDRADAAVMRRVHVAHLEAGALTGQAARSERRQAALVGDLAERVGLVHELRELRGAEELAHGGSRGLGVDQVLRHDRVDLDRAHALLDRTLHAQQADAVLVLHQLADRTHAAVAEIVDVVDLALAVAQFDQRLDHGKDVLLAQHAHGVLGVELETHVHLDAADGRKVVAVGVEEQRVEHRLGGFERRRLARTHDAVDVEQRILPALVLVDRQRVADVAADIDVVDVEDLDFLAAGLEQNLQRLFVDLVAGLEEDLAGLVVDDVLGEVAAEQVLVGRLDRLQALVGKLLGLAGGDLLALLDHDFAAVGVNEIVDGLEALEPVDR